MGKDPRERPHFYVKPCATAWKSSSWVLVHVPSRSTGWRQACMNARQLERAFDVFELLTTK